MNASKPIIALLIAATAIIAAPVHAQEVDSSIATCLKTWGKHPFGKNPTYKTLSTSVKVFGIGKNTADTEATSSPALVLINPGVNVMGGTTIELLNPNGWYCLRTNVNVMGGFTIKAHCKARLASASEGGSGTTVMGNNADQKGVTVMGSTQVEFVGCQ
jgi:hypothetical protein